MAEEHSVREHQHVQASPYRFQSTTYAPEPIAKGGDGKVRFAVEVMVYVSGAGLDMVDPFNSGNELMVAFRNYVRMKELFGYRHLGKSSAEITQMLTDIWDTSEWDKSKQK